MTFIIGFLLGIMLTGGRQYEEGQQLGKGLRTTAEGPQLRTGQGLTEGGEFFNGCYTKGKAISGAACQRGATARPFPGFMGKGNEYKQSLGGRYTDSFSGGPQNRKEVISSGFYRVFAANEHHPSRDLLLFEVTAYTAGPESTGKRKGDPGYGITFSGASVQEGVTIAADWDVLPKGTVVEIEGVGVRTVQDKGGAIKGNKIDIYIPKLKDAQAFGRKKLEVTILVWGRNEIE